MMEADKFIVTIPQIDIQVPRQLGRHYCKKHKLTPYKQNLHNEIVISYEQAVDVDPYEIDNEDLSEMIYDFQNELNETISWEIKNVRMYWD